MAKVFLVDLENVGWGSLLDLENYNLSGRDKIYVFLSKNCPSCPSNVLESITRSKSKLEIINVTIGYKDALDFQLACFLGRISKGSSNDFYIVSRDKSFSVLIPFLENVNIKQIKHFDEMYDGVIKLPSIAMDSLKIVATMTSRDKNLLRENLKSKLLSNKKLNFTNYSSIAGMIVKELSRSSNINDFKKRVVLISNKESYRREIINMCADFFN